MAGLSATSGGGFDYIQAAEPADPANAELWFDTDGGTDGNGEVKVYDGSQWDTTGYVSHDQLTNVSPGDHFSPGDGLAFSSGALELLLSSNLTVDGNGNLTVAANSLGQDRLAFDTATQSELNSHEGDTGNPHSVDHSQLSGVGSNDHHSKPTGTQQTGGPEGRKTGFYWPIGEIRYGKDAAYKNFVWLSGKYHEIRLSSSAYDATIHYADGTETVISSSELSDGNTWFTVDSSKFLAGVSPGDSSPTVTGVNPVTVEPHSHNI